MDASTDMRDPTLNSATIPSREEFIARARALVPALRDRAATTEENRRMAPETHAAFRDAGFYKLLQPARYGGYETDVGLVVDVAAELGRGCGSSCWVFTNLVMHGLTNGMKDPRAQDDVWGDNPDALIASSAPGRDAKIELVDGGVLVDGTWNYSSGIDFAEWNHLQLFLRPENGPPEHRFALVHKSDYEVVDDWFVTGLTGTGSRSIVVRDLFVPDYRTISSLQIRGGPTPGSAVNPGPLYRLPFWGLGSKWFASTAVGIARGALELIEEDIAGRVSMGGARLAEQPTVQVRLAESGAEIEAGWALIARDCEEVMRMTERGEDASLVKRAQWRRNNAYCGVLCGRAVDRLFALAGMRGMAPGSHIQRAWRDVHAVTCQLGIAWDPQAVNYGLARFGLPFDDPRV